MSQYFPKPYEPNGGDINVKVDLSNYAKKILFINAVRMNTCKIAAKSYSASLKPEVDKLYIDQLAPAPVN